MGTLTTVDFYFDPLCPWTWLTSRWLTEATQTRDIEVRWHVMSLAILNENNLDQIPQPYRELLGPKGWRPVRVLAAVADQYGNHAVSRLYSALGDQFHHRGAGPTFEAIAYALDQASLPAELTEHADTGLYDKAVRASHDRAQEVFGQETGTPVLVMPGADNQPIAFNGPIVTPAPKGEEAARLWDAITLLAATPGFYEIKRPRTGDSDLG
ncbi:DsbA family protein [Streptomyces sp. NPDC098789]|uniref:mycothiol-dependent nitroreductase Rv2466c family protein n=1 Tax=Streptomyces sp. NPDC098789 TaxID=3366098 RepID=UPI0038038076